MVSEVSYHIQLNFLSRFTSQNMAKSSQIRPWYVTKRLTKWNILCFNILCQLILSLYDNFQCADSRIVGEKIHNFEFI